MLNNNYKTISVHLKCMSILDNECQKMNYIYSKIILENIFPSILFYRHQLIVIYLCSLSMVRFTGKTSKGKTGKLRFVLHVMDTGSSVSVHHQTFITNTQSPPLILTLIIFIFDILSFDVFAFRLSLRHFYFSTFFLSTFSIHTFLGNKYFNFKR